MADVHYHNDDMDSWYQGTQEVNYVEIENITKKLRLEVLDKIYRTLQLPANRQPSGDWVADTIKELTEKTLAGFEKNNIEQNELQSFEKRVHFERYDSLPRDYS